MEIRAGRVSTELTWAGKMCQIKKVENIEGAYGLVYDLVFDICTRTSKTK